jgi:hypothetical protein
VFLRSESAEGEREEELQQLKEEQHKHLLALRQEQYFSQKYLQREHIKTVGLPHSHITTLLLLLLPCLEHQ